MISNSTGSSSCFCFIQVTTWCCNSIAHPTRCQSHGVGHWESSRTSWRLLAVLFCIIPKKMDLQASGGCCMCRPYTFIPHSRSNSSRSYSSWPIRDLVPFPKRHTGTVSGKLFYSLPKPNHTRSFLFSFYL